MENYIPESGTNNIEVKERISAIAVLVRGTCRLSCLNSEVNNALDLVVL